jgi:hypothetical protein
MSDIILRRAICLTGKILPQFSAGLGYVDVDPPHTLPAAKLVPKFAHPTRRSSLWGNQTSLCSPEAIMTPFITTLHQIPHDDTMELPISTPEEETADENDQESDGEALVIPKTMHRMPHAVEDRSPWIIYHSMRKCSCTND